MISQFGIRQSVHMYVCTVGNTSCSLMHSLEEPGKHTCKGSKSICIACISKYTTRMHYLQCWDRLWLRRCSALVDNIEKNKKTGALFFFTEGNLHHFNNLSSETRVHDPIAQPFYALQDPHTLDGRASFIEFWRKIDRSDCRFCCSFLFFDAICFPFLISAFTSSAIRTARGRRFRCALGLLNKYEKSAPYQRKSIK
jgi:hypothetical protein